MPMFRLKADIKFEANDPKAAREYLAALFTRWSVGDLTDAVEGQISLTPTEGPLADTPQRDPREDDPSLDRDFEIPRIEQSPATDDKPREAHLTPHECSEQFRMYARGHIAPEAAHQLNFCADFLDEFCKAAPRGEQGWELLSDGPDDFCAIIRESKTKKTIACNVQGASGTLIIDAHNAALAANHNREIEALCTLSQQLAAEQETRIRLQRIVADQVQQLAAEREKKRTH